MEDPKAIISGFFDLYVSNLISSIFALPVAVPKIHCLLFIKFLNILFSDAYSPELYKTSTFGTNKIIKINKGIKKPIK